MTLGLNFNVTSLTLAQINNKLDELQKDVNALLEADYLAALRNLKLASKLLAEEQYLSAYEKLKKVLHLSVRGYSQLKNFKRKVFCKKMSIYAIQMIACYKKETQSFVRVNDLTEKEQRVHAFEVFEELQEVTKDFQSLKPGFAKDLLSFSVTTVTRSREAGTLVKLALDNRIKEQNTLDSLLKTSLPMIWHHIDIFKNEDHKSKEILKYVPEGKEDCCEIVLERKWPIKVWKEKKYLDKLDSSNYDSLFCLKCEVQDGCQLSIKEISNQTIFKSISFLQL